MIQCEGQLSLMDLLSPIAADNEPPRLLREGQMVYKVVRGDVETHMVTGETWTCGEGNRGYRLKRIGGCWDSTWNLQINKTVFTDLEVAKRVAEQYLAENEHILAHDIRAIRVVAYRYKYNGRGITNFYAVLKDGNVYYRYGSMYEHIGKENEIKEFEKGRKKYIDFCGYKELKDYQPEYANMYKCSKKGTWLYAAARYEFIG
jgi:hypothetical protein